MPRMQETVGKIELSADELVRLRALLARETTDTNNGRSAAVWTRLLGRCNDVLDGIAAAEEGMSLAEYRCPRHEWAYTGEAYGGDERGDGRVYCVYCGADGDA